eukprot:TRINITY_DN19378_c0_g1_i1.p1 TRINITY_DN19378_c0_g1~~TRINITY_DN19378_c0_g1_i1.p1  ORF type:complete len:304 (+),score=51.06 TRINITY_DN19378_c0_g1_i1:88-999(+)
MEGSDAAAGADTESLDDGSARRLSLSLARVELRMYRRSRTACGYTRDLPKFEYVVRCDLSGKPRPKTSTERASSRPGSREVGDSRATMLPDVHAGAACWWDHLPSSFLIRRSWLQIEKFHEALDKELTMDPTGFRRVKATLPKLPEKGDLHKFLLGVAATGDACALRRKQDWTLPELECSPWQASEVSREDLRLLRWQYAENRLAPYFQHVNTVLSEVPTEILQKSQNLWKFVCFGVTDLAKPDPCLVRSRFLGSAQPLRASGDELDAVVKARRRKRQTLTDTDGALTLTRSLSSPTMLASRR